MKNVIKIGFLALSFGLFAVACGGGSTPAADSTAAAPIDTAAAQVAAPAPDSLAKVDSPAVAPVDTAAHH